MSQQSFGRLKYSLFERRRRSRLRLLLGVSAFAVMLALPAAIISTVPALAGDVSYTNGQTNSAAIDLTEDYALTAAGGVTATHSGVISGAGAISKEGTGELLLSGVNTYSGGTVINAGTLSLLNSDAAGTGTIAINDGTALVLSGASAMTIANDVELTGSTKIKTVQHATLGGLISGTGSLTKLSGGTLALSGPNTFSGGTTLYEGNIHLLDDQALGTGTLTNAALAASIGYGDGVSIANNIIANNGTKFWVGAGTATQAGTVVVGPNTFYLAKTGAGELVLTGKVGNVQVFQVDQGILTAGADNVLNARGTYSPGVNGTLRLWADQTVGAITGQGVLDLGSRRLEIASGNSFAIFDGALVGEEDANLVKTGVGGWQLDGNGTGYSGRFSLQEGFIRANGDFAGTPFFVSGGRLEGSGRVGDVFVDAGTLRGVDGSTLSIYNLSLSENATIEARLGAANAAALFDVAGDIVLDGKVDVINVGGFGQGIYRLFNYGGALDDRGLEIGAVPTGYNVGNLAVQTAVAGQVNLVADDPDYGPILFWDGSDAGKWNNGQIDGGDGEWRRGGNAFTDATGTANGAMNPHPGFVVFTGQAGVVNVVTGFGEVHPDGMQFAVDGYRIGGEMLSWDDGDRIIRVGDGTAAGANYTAEISAAIDGGGRLVKTDLGTLILAGRDFAYRGGTEVREGALIVNGNIGDVDVLADGRLGGTGSVQNADVAGTLAAGQSIGMLTVEGDLTMRAGSTLEVEVDADGNANRIDVTGVANLEGGRVVTLASGGNYAPLTNYTILTAEGGVEGQFEGVESNLAFLSAALNYGDKDVQLALTRNGTGFGNVGQTRNQIATGEVVEPLGTGNAIYDRVLTLSAADARLAFDHLSGEVHASTKGVLAIQSRDLRDAMGDRIGAAFDALGLAAGQQSNGTSVWSSASASGGTLKGDGNAADVGYSAGNLFVGADATFNQNWLLGFAVGYGQSALSIGARDSSASSSNLHVGVYGGGEVSDFTFKFGAGVTHHDIKTSRDAVFPGFEQTLTAGYGGSTTQVFGEIGHKFRFDSGLIVEPYANLALANIYTGAYTEEGGSAALSSNGGSFGTAVLTAGVRGSQQFVIGDGTKAQVTGAIGWTHATGGAPETQQAFAGGNTFSIAGAPVQGNSLFVKAGFGVELSENANLSVGYAGQFGTPGQNHGLKASLSVKF